MADFHLSNLLSIYDNSQNRPAISAEPDETLERCQNYILSQTGDYRLPDVISFGDFISIYADANDIRLLSNNVVIEKVGELNNLIMQKGHYIFLRAIGDNRLVVLTYSDFNVVVE